MSVEAAIKFLRDARRDEPLGQALEALEGSASWHALAEVASGAGFSCTPEELKRAHALDWNLRWARYSAAR
jgi:predicted ribosomally synthesized peptide with nif11-like leader